MNHSALRRAFLTAEWRYLVMLNYEVSPAVLTPLVPAGTTLDLWRGRALASVVGFRFLRTRVLGVPVPFHRSFDEVNLRFYVRREAPGGDVRRAVAFVRELVPRRAIALVARLAYNEPYDAVPMRSTVPPSVVAEPGRLEYAWRTAPRWHHIAAETVGGPALAEPDSEAAFVTEHYWGYTRQRDGGTVEYEVTHPRWRLWAVRDAELDADAAEVYGARFAEALAGPPSSAIVAEGSPVVVYAPRRLPVRVGA
jgi:uncharacterized protein